MNQILDFTTEIQFHGHVTHGNMALTSCILELGKKSNEYFITSLLVFQLKQNEIDENIVVLSIT